MKLETPTDLVFVIAVLVPGFIFSSVLSQLVPRRLAGTTETIILGYLTGTAFNYAICGFPVYLVLTGKWLVANQLGQLALWFGVTFLTPIVLAILVGAAIQHEWLGKFFKLIGLRWINLVPTGWDWIFSRTAPCFVLVTLQDGKQVAGWMGLLSMASSDPDKRDLYIEEVYTIPENGPWQPAPGSGGILIEAGQIAYIEFKGAE
jgi:hypothetical protein